MSMCEHWVVQTLDSGLPVCVLERPGTGVTAVALYIAAGSRFEHKELMGISHLTEHMLFKGTSAHPDAGATAAWVEGVGGQINAFTDRDTTCYWSCTPGDRLSVGMGALADMYYDWACDPVEFAKEVTVVHEEIRTREERGDLSACDGALSALFGGGYLGWPVLGSHYSLDAIEQADVRALVAALYVPRRSVLSVVGPARPSDVIRLASRLFERGGQGIERPSACPMESLSAPRWIRRSCNRSQLNVAVAWPAFARSDPRLHAATVAAAIIGKGMASRLFTRIREELGLAYTAEASLRAFAEGGYLLTRLAVEPGNAAAALRALAGELRTLSRGDLSEPELDRARAYLAGMTYTKNETALSLARRAGSQWLLDGCIRSIEAERAAILAVTRQEVLSVVEQMVRSPCFGIGVVGPDNDELEEAVLTF